jgi:hypothetical protein
MDKEDKKRGGLIKGGKTGHPRSEEDGLYAERWIVENFQHQQSSL